MIEDRRLDNLENRHFAADDRWLSKMDRMEKLAEPLIGELCREGKTVYYVNTCNGKTREATNKHELVEFLGRNNYI